MITISVDDGSELDFKTAELLRKYGLKATFYWSQSNPKHPVMSEKKMLEFVDKYPEMEIGQHTLTHQLLTKIPFDEAEREITAGAIWHYNLFQHFPAMFAPPRGYISPELARLVENWGYSGIRLVSNEKNAYSPNFALKGGYHLYKGEWTDHGHKVDEDIVSYWWHSWEVNENNDWDLLEKSLSKLNPKEVITNGEAIRLRSK